jgi:uncharacterized membrane protein YkvA (DUF1232 family)
VSAREPWRERARALRADVYALALAYRDPRVPWYAKLVAICVVSYALSPLDLIPDPIPVLGHLDDLVLLPLGIMLALRLVPAPVMAECRARARERLRAGGALGWAGVVAIVAAWLALALATALLALRLLPG